MRAKAQAARWRSRSERLGFRLVLAFTAVAVAAAGLVTAIALAAVRAEVSSLVDSERQGAIDRVVQALAQAYLDAGSWQQVDVGAAGELGADLLSVLVTDPQGQPIATMTAGPREPTHTTPPSSTAPTVPAGSAGPTQSGSGGAVSNQPTRSGSRAPTASSSAVDPGRPAASGVGQAAATPDRPSSSPSPAVTVLAAPRLTDASAATQVTGEDVTTVEVPVLVEGEQVGLAVIQLPPVTSSPPWQAGAAVQRSIVAAASVALLLAVAVGALVARRLTRPLAELTAATRAVARGDVSAAAGVHSGPGELGELARSFTEMAQVIEREDALRRAVVADVAHELRTPVTILRGQIEAVQDGVSQADETLVASLHEEVLALGRLVEDLATLSAAEAAGLSLHRESMRLDRLAEQVTSSMSAQLAEAQLNLCTQLEPVEVSADQARMTQVLTNLLSNAIKFTPVGGQVTCRVSPEGEWARLDVLDSGPGIPAEDLPLVFDRFFRGRSAGHRSGTGIGLAVVAELVAAHAGTVEVASPPGQGAAFTVRLPLAGDSTVLGEPRPAQH